VACNEHAACEQSLLSTRKKAYSTQLTCDGYCLLSKAQAPNTVPAARTPAITLRCSVPVMPPADKQRRKVILNTLKHQRVQQVM
jgi:hypothetical protein